MLCRKFDLHYDLASLRGIIIFFELPNLTMLHCQISYSQSSSLSSSSSSISSGLTKGKAKVKVLP